MTHKRLRKRIISLGLAALLTLGSFPAAAEELTSGEEYSEAQEIPEAELLSPEMTEESTVQEDPENLLIEEQPAQVSTAEENTAEELFAQEPEESTLSDGVTALPAEEESSGIRYILGRPMTEEEIAEQLAPAENLTPMETYEIDSDLEDDLPMVMASNTPTRYDAREQGVITSVKRQSPYNNCWAFTLASLLETSMLKQGYGTYDLSEEHLSYFLANRAPDPLGNTAGDKNQLVNGDYHNGGNPMVAVMHLSSWSGMTLDSNYPTPSDYVTQTLPAKDAYRHEVYLKNAVFSSYSEARMKDLLLRYQSVGVLINFRASSQYYNASTAAMANPVSGNVNHAVTIVGWDDSYSKENFSKNSGVTRDGAWIVKNSWGPAWGDAGYFYLSYEDKSIANLIAVTASKNPEYANNYFYDGSAGMTKLPMEPGTAMSVVYQAKASASSELLGEIQLASASDNARFSVQIYLNVTDEKDPTSGVPAFEQPLTVEQSYAGFQTVTFSPLVIAGGSRYSIVVTNAGAEKISYYIGYTTKNSWIRFEDPIAKGCAFYKANGGDWSDVAGSNYNPRIKAHTKSTQDRYALAWENTGAGNNASQKERTLVVEKGSKLAFGGAIYKNGSKISAASYGLNYQSAAENIVTVQKDGTLVGKATGTAKVTLTSCLCPGQTLTAEVRVVENVKNISVTLVNVGRIRVTWSKGANLDGYVLYRKEGNEGYLVRRSFPSVDTTMYADIDVVSSNRYIKPGVSYTYRVGGYVMVDGKRKVLPLVTSNTVTPTLSEVKTTVRAHGTGDDKPYNTLTWTKNSLASGYAVYRRVNGGTLTRIKMLYGAGSVNYTDRDVKALNTYQYVVRAFRKVNGKNYFGPLRYSGKLVGVPNRTTVWTTKVTSGGIRISWNRQIRANGYVIYRKTSGGSFQKIASVSDTSVKEYVDKTAKKGVTYQYAVKAWVKEFYGTMYGAWTPGKTVRR